MWCRYLLLISVLDFDECVNNTNNCDVNAYCNNTVGSYNCTCYPEYTGNGTSCTGKFLDNTLSFTIFCCYWNATRVPNVVFRCLNSKVCLLVHPFVPMSLIYFERWYWNGRNFKTLIVLKCFSSASVLFFFSNFDECANNTDNCDVNTYCNNRWFSRYVIVAMLVKGKQKIAH